MRTRKLAGRKVDTLSLRRGPSFVRPVAESRSLRGLIADMDSSRPRTVCGQRVAIDRTWSRTIEAVAWSRTRTDCGRGKFETADCLRTECVHCQDLVADY